MHGIYTYIPETNYVPREYSVAAILLLLFMVYILLAPVLNLLHFYISTFRSMCAVPNMTVVVVVVVIIIIIIIIIILLAFTTHLRVLASSVLRFRDHTPGRTTVGRTPLDE
jgi:amino acid transporter